MKANIKSRLTTDTPLFRDLIADIRKGEIKIPQFQRKFVWSEKQALDLLDSIALNYPIGSLLIWRTKEKLVAERNIGDFQLPETEELTPTNYVLDGQQRLTVIYSCLGAPTDQGGFSAAYNIETDSFQRFTGEESPVLFPLRLLYETTQVLDFRTKLKEETQNDEFQARLDNAIAAFTNYRIPVVTLKELDIQEVCPIFERINSAGTKLSIYDLMVAATWSPEFDLNNRVEDLVAVLERKNFSDIEPNAILKSLTAIKHASIRKDHTLALRGLKTNEKQELFGITQSALEKTVDLLSTEFGVHDWSYVPYEAIVVILAFLFANLDRVESADQAQRIRRWFWLASFSQKYRGGSDTAISEELGRIRDYVAAGKDDGKLNLGDIPNEETIVNSVFRLNNSRSQVYALALAQLKPRNITTGVVIDVDQALSEFNRKQFHHIYPRAYLQEVNEKLEHNSIANICFLTASENRKISSNDPHKYLPMIIETLGDQADSVFESNLLPPPKSFNYEKASYEDFVFTRAKLIGQHFAGLSES